MDYKQGSGLSSGLLSEGNYVRAGMDDCSLHSVVSLSLPRVWQYGGCASSVSKENNKKKCHVKVLRRFNRTARKDIIAGSLIDVFWSKSSYVVLKALWK